VRRRRFSRVRKPTLPENKINSQIRAPQVRVIGPEGEQLGVMSSRDAVEQAQGAGLDLVEVAPNTDPPVCKMMDYGKFRYQQQKRAHEAKKTADRYPGQRSEGSAQNRLT
jgi:translation initiation factor IF-3